MKTINHSYSTEVQLTQFLKKQGVEDNSRLLIQVFTGMTGQIEIEQLQHSFQKHFKLATLIGSSSDGNIINGVVPEIGQTTISFTQFEFTNLSSALLPSQATDFETGQLIGESIIHLDTQAIIAFTDGINTNGEGFLNGLSSLNPAITIAGGMAGDNGLLKQTMVFNLTESSRHGCVAVALNNPDLIVHSHYSFDWQAVGRKMQITRAKENVVYEIDHLPAAKVYEKYLGSEVANHLPVTGIEFPLIKIEGKTQVGRAVVAKLENGALAFAGNLENGDYVQFGIGSKEHILQSSYQALHRLRHFPIESIFIYSCMARRRFLGEQAGSELEPFKACTGIAGFYTYGEFFHSNNQQKVSLLNQTMTMLSLSESANHYLEILDDTSRAVRQHSNGQVDTLLAVSNLAVKVSNDLEVFNGMLEHEVDKKSQELLQKTLIDDITGLPSRQTLLRDLAGSHDEVLIVININAFSKINGFYGLNAGDELLLKVALQLQKSIAGHGHYFIKPKLYKLPSDEYAILSQTFDDDALQLGLRAINHEVFDQPYQILGFDILVQATWVFSVTEGSEKGLVEAELAGKEARLKKQNFVRFDAKQFQQSQQKIELAKRVRSSILEDRLYPVFQPIYNNLTGELDKYECLARLKDADGVVISPLVFIEVAQMIQMYPIMTEIMIHKSCQAFQNTGLNFSVNLSLEDILNESTQKMLFDAIAQYNVANQITFEILENQALEEDSAIFKFIAKVKKLGAKIAIDDFGSGFANYQHLAKLQVDIIKIDGSLIEKLSTDTVASSVVSSMLLFARTLDIKVIAEYVSDKDILEDVIALGIDYSQGFYLSEPLEVLSKELFSSKYN